MKLLSLETSGNTCGVALSDNGNLLADYSVYEANLHDKLLAELVRRILGDLNLKIDDLDAVAVASGPGSFTGLRIGAAFAKGMCFAGSPKLIAVPTLMAIAYSALPEAALQEKQNILPVIPSHKNLVYCQKFDRNCKPLTEMNVEDINSIQQMGGDDVLFCGPAFPDSRFATLKVAPVAELGYKMLLNNDFTDPEKFVPFYGMDFTPKTFQKNDGETKND